MIHVKICSIQDLTHVLAAAEAGADYVAFNFVPGVRRQMEEGKARDIIKSYRQRFGRLGPSLVGVFVDQPLSEVNRILDTCDLDMAQLSGQESQKYCLKVERPVIKAVHVPGGDPVEPVIRALDTTLAELEAVNILPLLDPAVPGSRGGTGHTFDWTIARKLVPSHQFLLGGGALA
ncbi:phosphoribosylanthranilate isomerase [Dehalococcoidia bacterium]|nr:phosphoribosylanthranilate isomerase [Dehalococcoidia bacterium]